VEGFRKTYARWSDHKERKITREAMGAENAKFPLRKKRGRTPWRLNRRDWVEKRKGSNKFLWGPSGVPQRGNE